MYHWEGMSGKACLEDYLRREDTPECRQHWLWAVILDRTEMTERTEHHIHVALLPDWMQGDQQLHTPTATPSYDGLHVLKHRQTKAK